MSRSLHRRRFITGTAAGGAASVLGFPNVTRAAKPYDGQTLSVFSYAGSYEAALKGHIIKAFEEATGARVRMDYGWWDMLPKLKASPPGDPVYDVVITDPTQGFPSIKEKLFQQIDLANIPNAKTTPQFLQDNWVQAQSWGVNLGGNPMVIGIHTDLIKEAPLRWHDLLRPDLKGKLSFYDAPYMSLFTMAQIKAGAEGRPGKGAEELKKSVDEVLRFSKENRDLVRIWWTSTGDFMTKLLAKEVSGGVVHGSGPFVAEDEGKPIKAILPAEGTAAVHLFWAIPAGTKRKRLAEEWINTVFNVESQVKWGAVAKVPVNNLGASELAAKESPFYKRFLPVTVDDWKAYSFYPYDTYFEGDNWKKITEFWDREVLRKA